MSESPDATRIRHDAPKTASRADEMQSPRVLLVDSMGGANEYSSELILSLAPLCKLTVFTVVNCMVHKDTGDVQMLPLYPEFGGPDSKWSKAAQCIRAYSRLLGAVWRHRRDVVHIQSFRFPVIDILLYLMMRPFLRCMVYTAHNALPHEMKRWHRTLYRLWYRAPSEIQVLSEYTKKKLLEVVSIPEERIVVLPHGNYERQYEQYQSSLVTEEFAVDTLRTVLLFGQVRFYKGVDMLIDAVAHMNVPPGVRFVVAGGGEQSLFSEYAALAEKRGVARYFDFRHGFLSNSQLSEMIAHADVTVFPYRHIYQSGALLLALTFGKAIVAADIPGFREYVTDDVDSALCDCSNAKVFAEKLQMLLVDKSLRDRLAFNARLTAQLKFSWPAIALRIVHEYERFIGQRS